MIFFVFLCIYFHVNLFNSKLVDGSYLGTEGCYGWSLMESRKGSQVRCKENLLMVGDRWKLYPVYEYLFKFEI